MRKRLVVSGRVQGVFFRDQVRALAEANDVDGWVRNLVDGRLEAELEGEPGAVERVVRWCRSGPPRARVTGVDVLDIGTIGERGFRVR